MGYALKGTCHATVEAAGAAACGEFFGLSGDGQGWISCTGFTGSATGTAPLVLTFANRYDPPAGAAPTAYTQVGALPYCEGYTAADGLELGWLVGAVWIAAAGVRFLSRGAKR